MGAHIIDAKRLCVLIIFSGEYSQPWRNGFSILQPFKRNRQVSLTDCTSYVSSHSLVKLVIKKAKRYYLGSNWKKGKQNTSRLPLTDNSAVWETVAALLEATQVYFPLWLGVMVLMVKMLEKSSRTLTNTPSSGGMGFSSFRQVTLRGRSPSLTTHWSLALMPSLRSSSWNAKGTSLGGTVM